MPKHVNFVKFPVVQCSPKNVNFSFGVHSLEGYTTKSLRKSGTQIFLVEKSKVNT